MNTISQEVDSTKQAVTAIDGKVQVLEGSASDVQAQLIDIQDKLAVNGLAINALQAKDTQQQQAIDEILSRLEALKGGGAS